MDANGHGDHTPAQATAAQSQALAAEAYDRVLIRLTIRSLYLTRGGVKRPEYIVQDCSSMPMNEMRCQKLLVL